MILPSFLDNEKNEFLDSFSTTEEKKKKGRNNSRPDLHPDIVKTAVYIKHLFMVSYVNIFYRFICYKMKNKNNRTPWVL